MDLIVRRRLSGGPCGLSEGHRDASAGATHFEHTYRWLMPYGRVKHVHAIAHALQDASGNREFVGARLHHQSKRAEEKIREQEAELRQMLTSRPNTLPFIWTRW